MKVLREECKIKRGQSSTCSPPIPWVGGKSRLANLIIARLPEHTCYCEVFGGAGWVLFKKPPSKCEVYNDRDAELVNMYRVFRDDPESFAKQFRLLLVSRKIWTELRRSDPETLSQAARAARFFYVIKASFAGRGGSFGTGTSRPSNLNLIRLPQIIEAVHERLSRVTIEQMDFRKLIPWYDRPETCFYLDPPYLGCPDYRHNMAEPDFTELRNLLREIKGKFLLSLNDHSWIRKTFAEFRIEQVVTRYTCARKTTARRPVQELLISNYRAS